MQFPRLEPGSQALGISKNANIPNEVSGSQPIVSYGIWNTAEYIIFFYSE